MTQGHGVVSYVEVLKRFEDALYVCMERLTHIQTHKPRSSLLVAYYHNYTHGRTFVCSASRNIGISVSVVTIFLAHRVRMSEILPWVNLILPMLSYLGRQVTSSCEVAS